MVEIQNSSCYFINLLQMDLTSINLNDSVVFYYVLLFVYTNVSVCQKFYHMILHYLVKKVFKFIPSDLYLRCLLYLEFLDFWDLKVFACTWLPLFHIPWIHLFRGYYFL